MEKVVFFAFKGESMCFVHVLLNALDMHNKGMDVKIVLEGQAVKVIKDLAENRDARYLAAREAGLFDCICKACSAQLGVLEYNEQCGIPLSDEMKGHPPMSRYLEAGYSIICL